MEKIAAADVSFAIAETEGEKPRTIGPLTDIVQLYSKLGFACSLLPPGEGSSYAIIIHCQKTDIQKLLVSKRVFFLKGSGPTLVIEHELQTEMQSAMLRHNELLSDVVETLASAQGGDFSGEPSPQNSRDR